MKKQTIELTTLEIPNDLYDWEKRDVLKHRKWLANDTYWYHGALRWQSNDAVIPMHVFAEAYVVAPEAQQAERDAHLDRIAAQYRHHEYDDETLAEMRNAFGAGTTVVNVLTGEKTKL